MDATTSAGLIVGIVLIALVRSKKNTDLLIWAGVIAMTIVPYQDSEGKIQTGILSIGEAFAALTNEGVIAIAALFIVAAGVKETGFLEALHSVSSSNTFYKKEEEERSNRKIQNVWHDFTSQRFFQQHPAHGYPSTYH